MLVGGGRVRMDGERLWLAVLVVVPLALWLSLRERTFTVCLGSYQ